MKPRYNLRIKPLLSTAHKKATRTTSSRVTKKAKSRHSKSFINQQTRRQSLRLTPTVKERKSRATIHETIPKWRSIENEKEDEASSISNDNDDDDYDDLLARHQRLMLEEQKDRKLYERYVRDQRTLRRLQCRRSHTAHLSDATRNRLLRELERERRYTIRDKICNYLTDHTIIYRHRQNIQPMNWSTLEKEVPFNRNIGTIHELDVMIRNLKKGLQNSNSLLSKARLSARERRTLSSKTDVSKTTETQALSLASNPISNTLSPLTIIAHSPRIPVVRFIDDQNSKLRASNSQRLTCIQNVLSHQSNHNRMVTNEISSPLGSRKLLLRPKSTHVNISELSATKKRPLEKENCSILSTSSNSHSHSNTVLRTSSPMVSIKHTTSSSSSRSYPNTRKHPLIHNSLTTRRQTRLSFNLKKQNTMIELPDLFHEHRISELSLSLFLYAPIGLCLVLLRSIALLILFLISSIFPGNSSLDQLIDEAISVILTLTYDNQTVRSDAKDARRTTKIIVANRVSSLDVIVLRKFLSETNCKVINLWKENSWMNWLKVSSSRTPEDLLELCVNQIQHSDSQLLFLPECEPTTGSDGLLKFNVLAFTLAQKLHLPVLPVCLRTSRAFQIRTNIFNSQPLIDLFWFLFSPYTKFHMNFLPIVSPTDSSSDDILCEQVRETMSRTMGIEMTQFDEHDVDELKKRPDLLQRRHEQRRVEFQQMVHLVHEQVPVASLGAIRYDLETTKNVQKTIANLNERVAVAARAASKSPTTSTTSSRAMTSSSAGSNHRQTYERLKQELIEQNRQLFLNKNSN